MKPASSIRLLHVVPSLAWGGMEQLLYEILRRLDSRTFEILVCPTHSYGQAEQRARFQSAGIDTLRVLPVSENRWKRVFQVAGVLRQRPFDIVHTHHYNDNDLYARMAAIVAGVPVILTYDHQIYPLPSARQRLLWWVLNRFTYRNVVISEAVKRYRTAACGGQPWKVVTVLNGIDLDRFHPSTAMQRRQAKLHLGFKPDTKVVAGVGRLCRLKRFDLLIRAAGLMKEDGVEFVIAGDGELREQLGSLVSELQLEDTVHLIGWEQDLQKLYAATDVVVSTSSFHEGFSLVVAEAMACGIPVVATDIAAHREVLSGDCGVTVDPNPSDIAVAIRHLLADEALASVLGHGGRRRAEAYFDINRTARELEALYLSGCQQLGVRYEH